MEINPIAFIGIIIIPVLIVSGIMIWATIAKRKNREQINEEKEKLELKTEENKLWKTLVVNKENHIDVLKSKLKNNQF